MRGAVYKRGSTWTWHGESVETPPAGLEVAALDRWARMLMATQAGICSWSRSARDSMSARA